MRGTSSIGKEPSRRTCSWMRGRNSRLTNSRTERRARISSSERSSSRCRKSTPRNSATGVPPVPEASPSSREPGPAPLPSRSGGGALLQVPHLLVQLRELAVELLDLGPGRHVEAPEQRLEPLHHGLARLAAGLVHARAHALGALHDRVLAQLGLEALDLALGALLELLAALVRRALQPAVLLVEGLEGGLHAVDAVLDEVGLGHDALAPSPAPSRPRPRPGLNGAQSNTLRQCVKGGRGRAILSIFYSWL